MRTLRIGGLPWVAFTPYTNGDPRNRQPSLRARGGRHLVPRRGRALERLPADVALPQRLLGRATAANPEQALGVKKVGDDGEVDAERDELQRREALDELVDLERQEHRRRDQGQVLRPPLRKPQADGLDQLERRIG